VLHGPDGQELRLELGSDYQELANGGTGKVKGEIVFAGYGISAADLNYDDYKDLDVEGKVLLIIRREPQQDEEKSAFDGRRVTTHSYVRTKMELAKNLKAAGVLLVNDPHSTKSKDDDQLTPSSGFGGRPVGVPFAHLTQELTNKLLASSPLTSSNQEKLSDLSAIEKHIDATMQPISQPLKGWSADMQFTFDEGNTTVSNVIGVLEGEGPLANETVVIGAHYDHLGYGPQGSRRPNERAIHNGADDNASGTAALMELARRFAQREQKFARRVVFIAFTAEERGLIGSNYYVENPLFPLEDTIAMFNFDMIGRLGDGGITLGGAQSAKEFVDVIEKLTKDGQIKVNMSGPVGASDHAGFYRKKIPVIFFWTGLTNEYHTPDDDFELINVEGVVKTTDLAEQVITEVIQSPNRPQFVSIAGSRRTQRGSMAYLGVVPDYTGSEQNGLRITDVNPESPASTGGLQAGDIITKIGEVTVADIQGLADGLRRYKAGEKVAIQVKRGEESKTVEVTLGEPK
jgi:hypothetical protein